jgi:hypothetical protein
VVFGVGTKLALGSAVTAVLVSSSALVSFLRALFRGGIFDRTWIMVAFMPALLGLLVWPGYVLRHASSLITAAGGDNLMIIAYLTAWLLPIG